MNEPIILTQQQLCKAFSVTLKTLHKWRNHVNPMPVWEHKGRRVHYNLTDCIRWHLEFQIEQRIGTDANGKEILDLQQERAHLSRAQKTRIDLELQVKRGELIPVESLDPVLQKLVTIIASHCDAAPPDIKRKMPHLSATELDRIRGHFVKMRNAIADTMSGEHFLDELAG
jgi:phage terminase Nu1 subunit (DNA packaging protein)